MRKTELAIGEYYHIYNRGVDKRAIFQDQDDLERFLLSIREFNTEKPIGSLYENSFYKNDTSKSVNEDQLGGLTAKLVEIVCYCLNHNHYHFLLKQTSEKGISEFMKRLGGGYTWYFNHKHKRNGSLFQGTFKSIHVDSNEYLLHLSSYINLNNSSKDQSITKSSWDEYTGKVTDKICNTDIILGQFDDKRTYNDFAISSYEDTGKRRVLLQGLEDGYLAV